MKINKFEEEFDKTVKVLESTNWEDLVSSNKAVTQLEIVVELSKKDFTFQNHGSKCIKISELLGLHHVIAAPQKLGLKLMLIICHEISIQRADELNEK
jgi:hypothetical protein